MAPHAARRLFGASSGGRCRPRGCWEQPPWSRATTLARTLLPAEIPLGIVTAIVGAGAFLGLMGSGRREHGG